MGAFQGGMIGFMTDEWFRCRKCKNDIRLKDIVGDPRYRYLKFTMDERGNYKVGSVLPIQDKTDDFHQFFIL